MNMAKMMPGTSFGPTLKRDSRQARRHLMQLNPRAEHIFPHCFAAIQEGIRGRIIDPQVNGASSVSRNVHLLVFYHLLRNKKHLPFQVAEKIARPITVGKRSLDGSFGLFDEARKKMFKGDSKELARLFADERIPMRKRLETLLAHMSDAMTFHSPETMDALPHAGLRSEHDGNELIFVNPKNTWEQKVPKMALTMNKVLCPAADLFGLSYVYRKIRDVSAEHINPDIYQEVGHELVKLQDSIEMTNSIVEDIIEMTNHACKEKGFQARIIRRNQDDARSHDDVDGEHKSKGSITDKLAKKRASGENIGVRGLHDVVARMVVTQSLEELWFVVNFLKDHAIPHTLRSYGIDFQINIDDYVLKPKEKTGYRSFHLDTVISSDLFLHFEFIVRTQEMHEEADYGKAAHHLYKAGELDNGLLLSFKTMLDRIAKNGKRSSSSV
jgi:ppGpp synthetase/RelA/SpoT-type nucleotidyltranferase